MWEPAAPNEVPSGIDVTSFLRHDKPALVVLQKIRGPAVVKTVRALRAEGIKTVWCVCDVVDNEMVAETDASIAVTEFLRGLYAADLQHRIHVVHDGIEDDQLLAASVGEHNKRPQALLVTAAELGEIPVVSVAPAHWRVLILGRYAASAMQRAQRFYWSVRVMPLQEKVNSFIAACDPFVERRPWSRDALSNAIRKAQIGIIPIDKTVARKAPGCDEPTWRVRSENRLTLLMAAGLPVIATPIPAYEKVIVHGQNGFFATTNADWRRLFHRLRDPDVRVEIGRRARESVLTRFSMRSQAERFIDVVRDILR
jgi:glycosyltransferase involved in cell wall biosynthesis